MMNVWLATLFDILPIPEIRRNEKCMFTSRKELVQFVFKMHEQILGEHLNQKQTLLFFEQLRANECSKKTANNAEVACVRTDQKSAFVAAVVVASSSVSNNTFAMEVDFLQSFINARSHDTEEDIWEHALTTEAAFCSCVFSVKWFVLHMIAYGYPKQPSVEQREKYHTFLSLFGKLLACFACRLNFETNLEVVKYNPQIDLASHRTMVTFMHHLHDIVNEMLHKSYIHKISLEETTKFFSTLATQTENQKCYVVIGKEKDTLARFYFSK